MYFINLKFICYLLPQLSSIDVNLEKAGVRCEIQTKRGYDREKQVYSHLNSSVLHKHILIPDSSQSELPFRFTEASLHQGEGGG